MEVSGEFSGWHTVYHPSRREVEHSQFVSACNIYPGRALVWRQHQAVRWPSAYVGNAGGDGQPDGVDGDRLDAVTREVIAPDVAAVPESLFVGEPADCGPQRSSLDGLQGRRVEDRNVLEPGPEGVAEQTAGGAVGTVGIRVGLCTPAR